MPMCWHLPSGLAGPMVVVAFEHEDGDQGIVRAAQGGGIAAWQEWAHARNGKTNEAGAVWAALTWAVDRIEQGEKPVPPRKWDSEAKAEQFVSGLEDISVLDPWGRLNPPDRERLLEMLHETGIVGDDDA